MIIDIHSHFNTGDKFDYPENEIHKRNRIFIKEDYDNCGIKVGGFSQFSSLFEAKSDIFYENEKMEKLAIENDWIYQWVVLDPRKEELFAQAKRILNNKKTLGIKIHSVLHEYNIEEYVDEIFNFANDLKCFVLMHPDKISDMVKFADKYPNMKLIIAHLGSVEHVDAIEKAKHGNIYTDTSGMASCNNNIVEYAVSRVGSEKIFFGTDTYSCGFQVGRIQFARISSEDKENILCNNAKGCFAKQFSNI